MSKRGIAFGLVFSLFFVAHAQRKMAFPFGGEYNEEQVLHLGFFFTYQIAHYKATKNPGWQLANGGEEELRLQGISTPSAIGGVGFGIPVDVRLGGNLNFILRPTYLIFSNQSVNYTFLNTATGEQRIIKKYHKEDMEAGASGNNSDKNFFAFEMPVLFKFKSDMKQLYGEDKYRGYIVGGAKFSRNIGRNKYYNNLTENPPAYMPLIVKPYYFSYEAGVGVDLFFDYFKMSAELKWSQSMNSVLDKKWNNRPNPFMDPIDKLLLRSLQFSLIFE